MGTTFRGGGSYKRDLLLEIYANFGFTEFTFSAAAEIPGFERGIFYKLHSDGWLACKKPSYGPYIWRLRRIFQNILLTTNLPLKQIHLSKAPIRKNEKQNGLPKKPIKSPKDSGSAPVVIKPRVPDPTILPPIPEDFSYEQLSERVLKALSEMLKDKESYRAFSSDLTTIMLKHAFLWIEKEKKKPPRLDGILIESKGFSQLQCPRCQSLNMVDATFCGKCGNQLQDTFIEKARKKNQRLRQDDRRNSSGNIR